MKRSSRTVLFLLLAVLPISLLSQTPTNILAYMKVTPGQGAEYLEVEQAWKKVHQKAVELGIHNGWQLWRKIHVGANDPYQYITSQWYTDYAHALGEVPAGWMEGVYSEEEWAKIGEKTTASRTYVSEEVIHLVTTADVVETVKYIWVARIKVKPGMQQEYVKMEKEIFKPYFEAMIKKGGMSYWGIWNTWPYNEGQPMYTAVQGFSNIQQFASPAADLSFDELNLDYTQEQINTLVQTTRDMVSLELWELVDSVFPEE